VVTITKETLLAWKAAGIPIRLIRVRGGYIVRVS
jgi:hypothetical protein